MYIISNEIYNHLSFNSVISIDCSRVILVISSLLLDSTDILV